LVDLLFEFAVLGAHPAQENIVMPEIAGTVLRPDQGALEGSDRVDCPDADQPGILRVATAFDLHRKAQHL